MKQMKREKDLEISGDVIFDPSKFPPLTNDFEDTEDDASSKLDNKDAKHGA